MEIDRGWHLLRDMCRCYDSECPDRDRCKRYLARNDIGIGPHSTSLMDPQTETCQYFMPVPEEKSK